MNACRQSGLEVLNGSLIALSSGKPGIYLSFRFACGKTKELQAPFTEKLNTAESGVFRLHLLRFLCSFTMLSFGSLTIRNPGENNLRIPLNVL